MNDEDFAKKTMEDIIEHGHQVRYIFPTQEDEGPPFSYTVGRAVQDKPELLITGPLPPEVAQQLLNDACALYDAQPFVAGDEVDKLLRGYMARVVEVDDLEAAEMFGVTEHFSDATALQIVWPDQEGRFPGEPGCTLTSQPLFGKYVWKTEP